MAVPPGSTTFGKSSKTTAKLYKIFTAVSKKKPFSANSHTKTTRSKHGACSRRSDSSPTPPHSPPVFPVYNLTLSPLTAALYYLNAWNRLSLFIILPILECESKHWKKSDLDAKRLESNCQVSLETTNFTARYQQGKQRNKS